MHKAKIKSIKYIGLRQTYDLHTPKYHNHFLSNGILGHNSGKSITGILALALELIHPNLTINAMCFTPEQVLERCKELKKNTVVILDEQILSLGVGSVRESLELRNLEEITRKNKLSFIFISPTPRQHLTAHYNMEVFNSDRKAKINWLAISENDKYIGYVKLKVNPKHPLWIEYDKPDGVKNKFIEKYLERKVARLDYEKMSKGIVSDKRVKILVERNGFIKMDDMLYVIGRHYPSITSTERKELLSELKIMNPELFTKKKK